MKLLSMMGKREVERVQEEAYVAYKAAHATGTLPLLDEPFQVPKLVGCWAYALSNHYDDKAEFISLFNKVLYRLNRLQYDNTKPWDWLVVVKEFKFGYKVYHFQSPLAGSVVKKALKRREDFLVWH